MQFQRNHEEKEEDEQMLLLTLWPPSHQNLNISQISPWNSSSDQSIIANSANPFPSEPSDLTIALSTAPSPGVRSTSAGKNQTVVTPVDTGSHDTSQYWIPSPSEILVSTAQFSCTVCHRTFKRFNNMQVYRSFD